MGKLRVLEICLGRFLTSGSSVMVWNWYQKFDSEKFTIDFFCLNKPEELYLEEMKKKGSQCFYWDKGQGPIVRKIMRIRLLNKVIKKNTYDCIHVHISSADFVYLVYFLSKRCNAKVIVHSHNSSAQLSHVRKLLHIIGKLLLRNADIRYFACSEPAAQWLFPSHIISEKKYTIINNGIDVSKFAYDPKLRQKMREKLEIANSFVIGHVGRFVFAKNHEFLIRVFAEVKNLCPGARLLLVGDGEKDENLKDEIRDQVKTLKLENDVIFYGNTDKVNEVYQAMDCFVLPSRFEGLPVSMIEAQTTGLPILCSDIITHEAAVTDLVEYLSLDKSVETWAEKIVSFHSGREREDMSQKIIAAHFDLAESARYIESQYERYGRRTAGRI